MKILLVHNRRLTHTGEDSVVDATETLLQSRGHDVQLWAKDNAILDTGLAPKIKAFFSGAYSRTAAREMDDRLRTFRPDVVHVHNIFPMFSPSILSVCRQQQVPVFYHCHNHQFSCPTTFEFRDSALCSKCAGGHEYWCAIHNCQGTRLGSVGYAMRSAVARRGDWFHHVAAVIVPSQFLRTRLIQQGFASERVRVLPNFVDIPIISSERTLGPYAAYIGRLSVEKGISVLMDAAARIPEIPFHIAGVGPEESIWRKRAPSNVRFVGFLDHPARDDFYRQARIAIVPSLWHEPFGLAAAEPMAYGVPVIATTRGGLPEIVLDRQCGLLVPPHDVDPLIAAIRQLWFDPVLVAKMGADARSRAIQEFSSNVFYQRLMAIYQTPLK